MVIAVAIFPKCLNCLDYPANVQVATRWLRPVWIPAWIKEASMRGWFESTFGAGALAAQFVVALIVVIVLFGIIAAFARRRNKNAGPAHARGRQPRLAVMDMADVDERRKLILIRRDNVEHLVMIGGPSDLVVESAIIRNRPTPHAVAPQAAERSPERPPERAVAGLAMQAQSRAQARPQSAPAAGSEAALGDGSGKGSGTEAAEVRTAPPVRSPQFVNPYKVPELARDEKPPGSPAIAGRESPAATDGQQSPAAAATPAPSAQTASPASGAAAVAGLAAGAAALTAAAASVKRRDPSSDPETPPEMPVKAPPVLPAGFNGGDGMTTTARDAAPDAALGGAATPEPAAPEPTTSEDAAKATKGPDVKTAVEPAAGPVAAGGVTNGATPAADAKTDAPTDAQAGTDALADAQSEETAADGTPAAGQVPEPVEAAEPVEAESTDGTGETSADESTGESADESQPEAALVADAADETGAADGGVEENVEAALAEALAPAQDQIADLADISTKADASTPTGPDEAATELTAAADDTAAETAPRAAPEAAVPEALIPATSFEEIMAENAPDGDSGDRAITTPPQTDAPAAPEREAAASGDSDAETAGKTAEPATGQPAAISPFPTIPEDVRRSVLEAAQRAENSLDADSGTTDGSAKTTLGDLAERLEQALAEQASTLSGQLQKTADGKPAPGPVTAGPAQGPTTSIEAWESGELATSSPQEAAGEPDSVPPPDAESEAQSDDAPRQSQAMLEDETDSGVIDFSDRKKAAPENKPSDSLEDEMARLLGELTGRTSGR
jgi:hypothetical protein